MRETLDEARHHLSLPIPLLSENKPAKRSKAPTGTRQAARRLWAASKPVADSPVAAYLASRQIIDLTSCEALRFHGNCWYRPSKDDAPDTRPAWPAMIAAVTDLDGSIHGVHRTRSEEHTSELQSLMRISYAVFCLK